LILDMDGNLSNEKSRERRNSHVEPICFSRFRSLFVIAVGFLFGMGTLVLNPSAREGRTISFDAPGADTNPADNTGTYPAGINALGTITGGWPILCDFCKGWDCGAFPLSNSSSRASHYPAL